MEIQLWKELLNPYELAVNEIVVKFDHVIKENRELGRYSPIEQVVGRVKSIPSLLEKAQKKKVPLEDIESRIVDIAGVRIICQFVEDIESIVYLIRNRSDMEIKTEKDYITNPKKSGYRSYHMIVYYMVETLSGSKRLLVELQIRTLAMNFWATIEHSLQYKYERNMPVDIQEKLRNAAESILDLDGQMSHVRNEIMETQNSFQMKANVVEEVLNSIQNLGKITNKEEVVKIQDEFYKIYQTDNLENLKMFSKQLDVLAEGYHAQAVTIESVKKPYKDTM